MPKTFKLSIITPEHSFFEDDVEMLVFDSADGEIGVLPGHEPMIVAMEDGEIRIRLKGGAWRDAATSRGFATIRPQEVLLLTQTAEWPEEIDVRRAEEDRYRAQEQLRQRASLREYHLARTSLSRAMARLRVVNRHNINGN